MCNKAAQIASVSSPRAPSPSVPNSNGAFPATGTSVASAVPLRQGTISTKGTRALCAAPLGHGPSSAKGARAHGDVPLSRGKMSATGVRVPNAAPLNHGKGACASRAAHPSHASRSNEAAATARRPPKQRCSPSPLFDHVVAVVLRFESANSQTLLSGHEVAVGLRCGKASTETPRYFERLDPVFPRDSSSRSIRSPIKEESKTLATSSPFSKRSNGKKPSRVARKFCTHPRPAHETPTGSAGPAPSSSTLTHVHQAA